MGAGRALKTSNSYSEMMEATPRIELGMEVLQFVAGLSSRCNWGQSEYESAGLWAARYNRRQLVRQQKWQQA